MAKIISMFNHKGGVSKTTTTFHLSWMFAEKGKRTLMVDMDPQCNLTGLVLGLQGVDEIEKFYSKNLGNNVRDGLLPAFESMPKLIEPLECVAVQKRPGLFLLPGHIGLSEFEVTLGIAQQLTSSISALRNIPGSISYLIRKTAEKLKCDYVFVDMNPSLSSLNQNVLMTSDYFILPTNPDYFSIMAINSLSAVLPKWTQWAKQAAALPELKGATYPLTRGTSLFLGTIIQRFRPRGGEPTIGFQAMIDQMNDDVRGKLIPALEHQGLVLPPAKYSGAKLGPDRCLALIADFNTLIATAQDNRMPVFSLTQKELGQAGVVLEGSLKKVSDFRNDFEKLHGKIAALTT